MLAGRAPRAAEQQQDRGREEPWTWAICEPFVSQAAASLITRLEPFAPPGKGKKKGFRAPCSFSGFCSSLISLYLPPIHKPLFMSQKL